jgi:phosphoribosyl-ATP pyrophosphohydrolase
MVIFKTRATKPLAQISGIPYSVAMTIELSKETEAYLEAYLVQEGLKKEAMSKVAEEAIETFLFRQMLDRAGKRNADLSPEEAETLAEDVVAEDRIKQRKH